MSDGFRRERMAAVGLLALVALHPVVGVSGSMGGTAVTSDGPRATPPGSAIVDTDDAYHGVEVLATRSTFPFASLSRDTGTAAVASTNAPELGQAATPTSTPSPLPTTPPEATRAPVGPTGPDPVLVLSGLIVVVLLALGMWFLLR